MSEENQNGTGREKRRTFRNDGESIAAFTDRICAELNHQMSIDTAAAPPSPGRDLDQVTVLSGLAERVVQSLLDGDLEDLVADPAFAGALPDRAKRGVAAYLQGQVEADVILVVLARELRAAWKSELDRSHTTPPPRRA
jgi:hypothetical protein